MIQFQNTDGEIRTRNNLFLKQVPLPIRLRRRKNLSGRIRTCEHLLPKQARVAICGTLRKIVNWFREKESNLYLLIQSQPSCQLDDPEMCHKSNPKSKITNPKSKMASARLELATSSLEDLCSDSIELRSREIQRD
jgi:hypothetical protein